MRRTQQIGRVAVVRLAGLLVVLLVLHHPMMGLAPLATVSAAARPVPGPTAVVTSAGDATMSMAPTVAVGHGHASCPICVMACPLMHGVAPNRPTVGAPASVVYGMTTAMPSVVAFAPPAFAPSVRAHAATAASRALPSRVRRAVLQVFLL